MSMMTTVRTTEEHALIIESEHLRELYRELRGAAQELLDSYGHWSEADPLLINLQAVISQPGCTQYDTREMRRRVLVIEYDITNLPGDQQRKDTFERAATVTPQLAVASHIEERH